VGDEKFKEKKMEELADTLMAHAEKIIKQKQCNQRHKNL
jgi:hypothetical protein